MSISVLDANNDMNHKKCFYEEFCSFLSSKPNGLHEENFFACIKLYIKTEPIYRLSLEFLSLFGVLLPFGVHCERICSRCVRFFQNLHHFAHFGRMCKFAIGRASSKYLSKSSPWLSTQQIWSWPKRPSQKMIDEKERFFAELHFKRTNLQTSMRKVPSLWTRLKSFFCSKFTALEIGSRFVVFCDEFCVNALGGLFPVWNFVHNSNRIGIMFVFRSFEK